MNEECLECGIALDALLFANESQQTRGSYHLPCYYAHLEEQAYYKEQNNVDMD